MTTLTMASAACEEARERRRSGACGGGKGARPRRAGVGGFCLAGTYHTDTQGGPGSGGAAARRLHSVMREHPAPIYAGLGSGLGVEARRTVAAAAHLAKLLPAHGPVVVVHLGLLQIAHRCTRTRTHLRARPHTTRHGWLACPCAVPSAASDEVRPMQRAPCLESPADVCADGGADDRDEERHAPAPRVELVVCGSRARGNEQSGQVMRARGAWGTGMASPTAECVRVRGEGGFASVWAPRRGQLPGASDVSQRKGKRARRKAAVAGRSLTW